MQKEIDIYIEKFYSYLKVNKKYSVNTIKAYISDIEEYISIVNKVKNINDKDISKYLTYLHSEENLLNSSISRKLTSVRRFYQYLFNNDLILCNYFDDVSNPKKNIVLPKYINETDLSKLFDVCMGSDPISQRDRLIIELLYETGIRVDELVNIKLTDINFHNNEIKINGKGSKQRIVIYNDTCKEALYNFIDNARPKLYKKETFYLFIGRQNGHISSKYVRDIINKIKVKAMVDGKITPHVFRHTFATDMLNNGADLVSVKDLLGHESLNTTSVYTHLTDEQIKQVYNMAHPRAKKE